MSTEQGNQRTIFLLEEDEDTRRALVQNLRRYGYRVILALDEEDALDRISGGGVRADLVLVNLIGKTAEGALDVGRRVRKHAGFNGHTPLVVMPEKYSKELEGTEVTVSANEWVFYLGEEPDQLRNFLERLMV